MHAMRGMNVMQGQPAGSRSSPQHTACHEAATQATAPPHLGGIFAAEREDDLVAICRGHGAGHPPGQVASRGRSGPTKHRGSAHAGCPGTTHVVSACCTDAAGRSRALRLPPCPPLRKRHTPDARHACTKQSVRSASGLPHTHQMPHVPTLQTAVRSASGSPGCRSAAMCRDVAAARQEQRQQFNIQAQQAGLTRVQVFCHVRSHINHVPLVNVPVDIRVGSGGTNR